jgi:hypothetical protein
VRNFKGLINKNLALYRDNKEEFEEVFGVDLIEFISPTLGFDKEQFYFWLLANSDYFFYICYNDTLEIVRKEYGGRGICLLQKLLKKTA